MARQTTVTLVDDLDGSEAEEQVEFSVDGRTYEIDLSTVNASRLRDALAPFVSAAPPHGRPRAPPPRRRAPLPTAPKTRPFGNGPSPRA